MLWMTTVWLVTFENKDENLLLELIHYLSNHPKRASDPSRFQNSTRVGIYFRCTLEQLKIILENIKETVRNTTNTRPYPAGHITPQQKINFMNGIKGMINALKIPVIVYFSTLVSDSGITSWIQGLDLQDPATAMQEFFPILVKGALVAILPTIAATLVIARKRIEEQQQH